ncbi:MAG: molybdopterin-dependent oxidoreductase, partial [Bacillota bacterium]
MSEAPKAPEMVTFTIDGKTGQAPKGTLLVEAAKAVGVEIPVFCYHPKLDPAGVCRMCLVQVEKMPKPVTACTTPVTEGMVVHTQTPVVDDLRKGVLEFLLINHPLDCPVCDKGGECDLQDLTFEYGAASSRLADGKVRKNKAVDLGPFIVLDEERCILCRRCVRFDDEVAGEQHLVIGERGHRNVVATNDGEPYDSYFSGNTIELCPVGALTSEVYRFKARPWDLSSADGICTGCSVGCNVREDFRHGRLLRLISRDNPAVDNGWLCDRGRFNYTYVNLEPAATQRGTATVGAAPAASAAVAVDAQPGTDLAHLDPEGRTNTRLTRPLLRKDGKLVPVSWQDALSEAARRLKQVREEKGAQALGVIGGGRLTNEEAYLLQKFARAGLGTANVDHRVAGQTVASLAGFTGRLSDLDEAQVTLLVDVVPAEQAPVMDLRLVRGLERRRMKMLAVGSVMPSYRSRHARMQVRPGQTAAVLAALTQAVSGQAAAAVGNLQARDVDLDLEALHRAAQLLTSGDRVAVVWDGADAAAGQALMGLMKALGKGHRVKLLIAGEQNNSRGAEAMGVRPDLLPGFKSVLDKTAREAAEKAWQVKLPEAAGLSTRQMLEAAAAGSLNALVLAGANLVGTFPDGSLARRALEQVDLLIVSDLFLTATAAMADIVFPAAPFAMKEGTYTNLDGLVQFARRTMEGDGLSQPDLTILDGIAALMGKNLVKSDKDLKREIKSLAGDVSDGAVLPALPVQVLEQEAAAARGSASGPAAAAGVAGFGLAGLVLVAAPRLFAGGGTAWFDPALRDVYPRAEAALNPADAVR